MKRLKQHIFTLLAAGMVLSPLSACTDYLDKAPESEISSEEAFKNFRNFQGFVEEMYFCVPDFVKGYWNNSFNWGDDEIIQVGINYMMGYKIDQGDFWGWQAEYDGWGAGWMDINGFDTSKPADVPNRPTLWK
ncbi:MAG: RagB/SusD family nutrient uptake outer membrane protein, partial [Muribaculaceae bacterium]|nr:RagB/SusD family nutrient uptake outer membrane protein [Muribaculaceae bacterium]